AVPFGIGAALLALYAGLVRRGVGLAFLAGFDRASYSRLADKGRFHRAASNVFCGLAALLSSAAAVVYFRPGSIVGVVLGFMLVVLMVGPFALLAVDRASRPR